MLKHILSVFAGLIVLFWTLYLMVTPLKFALGFILFLITFTVGELLFSEGDVQSDTESRNNYSRFAGWVSWEFVVVGVFVISLIILFLVPSIKGEIFIEWSSLEFRHVARLIAAFGLNFFPGYLILAIVGKPELNKLQKVITSYLLSLFMVVITGFVSARLTGIVDDFFLMAFLFVCAILIVVYFLKRLVRRRRVSDNPKTRVSSHASLRKFLPTLLVGLTIVFVGVWLFWMYSNIGFFIGAPGTDMWRQHGYAQTFLDYRAFLWINIPWWFDLYLACFIVMAGVPSANAHFALYPLIVLPVLSFHIMASGFLKNRRMASLATLSYAIFSGPAWFYALHLRDFGPVSYDSWIQILYETGDKFLLQSRYPPFVVGFTAASIAYTSLWWMMYATSQLDLREKFSFFLMSVTVAVSYLVHGVDPVIFIVYLSALLLVFLFTQNDKGKKQVRFAALSVIVALAMVSVIELSLTPQYDYYHNFSSSFARFYLTQMGRYYYLGSPSFYLLALSSSLIVVTTYIKVIETKLVRFYQLASQKSAIKKYSSSIKKHAVEIIFYLYGVALIVWFFLHPSFSTSASGGVGWVPWYVYPVAGGVPYLFGLVGVFILVLKWGSIERKVRDLLAFAAIAAVLLFFFGQSISFFNETFFYLGYWERRTLSYIHPLMSILMAYALVTLFGTGRRKGLPTVKYLARIGAVSVLTSLIILGSVSSTLIAGDFAFRGYFWAGVTEEELEALGYLHYSLPEGFNTGYLARQTGFQYIASFARDKWTPNPYLWLGQYYHYPSSAISAIRQGDVRFLYLNHIRDDQDLKKNLFIQQLIKVLPVEFNNSEVTIYSIPPLEYPSSMAPLRLVSLEEEVGAMYDAYVLWSLTLMMGEYPYGVISNVSNPVNFAGAQSIMAPHDPPPIERDVEQLLGWVSNGGHLILSNTNPYGMFSKLVGLISKVSLVDCDSILDWRILRKTGELIIENADKIEGNASLRLTNDQSSYEEWIYTPPTGSWNLSGYEYLGIWVYNTPIPTIGGGGGPKWLLYLTDSNDNENYFRYDLSFFDYEIKDYVANFTGWKLHLIPIKQYYGNLDVSAINQLRIVTGSQRPINILIDDIFVLEESGKEHSIATADGIQGPISIDLPIIEVEGLSPSADVRVIANYTLDGVPVAPFAIQKDLDSGKVTYLNANLLYQSILSGSSAFTSPYEVLIKILEIIGVE